MPINSAQDFFKNELREIHSAEKQLSRALPRLSKALSSQEVRQAMEERLEHGRELLESIEEVAEEMGLSMGRQKNQAIEGLIEDARELSETIKNDKVLDAALIAGVQKIEHYCIAAWGTAAELGRSMGQQRVAEVFERALDQGKRFDKTMTGIAVKQANPAMMDGQSEAEPGRGETRQETRGGKGQDGGGRQDRSMQNREYRDEDGNVHHHTKAYMEQHKGEQQKGR